MKCDRILSGAMALGVVFAGQSASAADAYSPQSDPVPPNILFLIDNSASMATCWHEKRVENDGDGQITDRDRCIPAVTSAASLWRIKTVQDAVLNVVENIDNAYFGLAVTDPVPATNPDGIGHTAFRDGIVVPLGSDLATFKAGMAKFKTSVSSSGTLTVSPSNATPLAEALDDVREYFETGAYTTDADYMDTSPIKYYCQASHVILITDGVTASYHATLNPFPDIDKSVAAATASYAASPDFAPTASATEGYYNRYLENVASYLANSDLSVLANSPNGQHVSTHVLALDNGSDLLEYTAENGDGVYSTVSDPDDLEGELWYAVNTIMQGTYIKAAPTVSTTGDKLFVGYFEVKPDRPLYYGHLLAFDIQDDPNAANFGEIDTAKSQPSWDAGVILASRWVGQQDVMNEDNNGTGTRDIYTNIDNDEKLDPFDGSNLSTLCPMMLDTSVDAEGDFAGVAAGHDVDGDGDVDESDCMKLMDFVRGYYLEEFLSTGQPRGFWKLGDIRHSQVAIADREPNIRTRNENLRGFLENELPQTMQDCPYAVEAKCALDVVFVTANDGMLHAFQKESGDELWAYIPRSLLGETAGEEEVSELIDMMRAETITFDATPRIDYIWIDGYMGKGRFGAKDGNQAEDEWLRVLVVGQGGGGRYYLAMDITDPQHPYLLWEDTNDTDPLDQVGATTSTAAVGLIYDQNNEPAFDRWVAFYGSGKETESVEGRLYIKALDDVTTTATSSEGYDDQGLYVKIDLDKDGADDGKGFPSNPTAIDRDNDGDVDEVFLINSVGVMYKFQIDTTDVEESKGCLFFDPQDAKVQGGAKQYVARRTSSYWAATAAFTTDGDLVLYWGTGSPYDLFTTDYGYLYAVVDSTGCAEGELYTECNGTGYVQLEKGEKLTGSPVVYARTVYFPTFKPSSDRCSKGEGRLYGLNSQSCAPGLDTNGDGTVDEDDKDYTKLGEGIPSGIVLANESIYVATSDGLSADGIEDSVHRIEVANDPFASTVAIQWRELF